MRALKSGRPMEPVCRSLVGLLFGHAWRSYTGTAGLAGLRLMECKRCGLERVEGESDERPGGDS
jgi:hypothetical protein